jgi:acetolactate synthase-1/2/3 large subunit
MKDSASASPDPAVLARQVAARLLRARRPIILAGQGAMGGAGGLRRLAEALCCPVATTLSGRGVLPEDHPLSLSVDMGGYGLTVLNEALDSADLVLVLGCKLTHNGTGGFQLRLDPKRCLRVDASPEVIGATLQDAESLLGDVQRVLEALLQHHGDSLAPCAGWSAGEVAQLRARARSGAEGPEPRIAGLHPSTPAAFFEDVRAAIPRDTVVVTDSGLHQTLVRRYWKVLAPRGLITPSDFQSMGFGIPAALGARLGGGNRPVVAIAGDGGFHMAGLELLTAVRDRIPVTVIVFNDGYLGTIRLQQLAEFGHAHGVRLATPDYAGFAAAIGADYSLAGAEPGSVVARAVASNRVTLIEVRLGDSWGIHAARGRALFTGTARRVIPSRIRRWLRRRRS